MFESLNHEVFIADEFLKLVTRSFLNLKVECRNLGGYLTQITDFAENSWIVNMITSKSKYKRGG